MGSTEITEKNKIIAEFMGSEFDENKVRAVKNYPTGIEGWFYDINSYLKFNSSWDWLMPVVEKIELIDRSKEFPNAWERVTHLFTVKIKDRTCVISPNMWAGEKKTFKKTEDTKLQATFEAVYQFIEWSNKNQK